MPNYQNGKIYRIECEDGHYYIGSTTKALSGRKADHKSRSKTLDIPLYRHIAGDWSAVDIVLVEDCPCENKEQLHSKEAEHIRAHRDDPLCLNRRTPLPTDEEKKATLKRCVKAYYEANKDEINERKQQRRLERKEDAV